MLTTHSPLQAPAAPLSASAATSASVSPAVRSPRMTSSGTPAKRMRKSFGVAGHVVPFRAPTIVQEEEQRAQQVAAAAAAAAAAVLQQVADAASTGQAENGDATDEEDEEDEDGLTLTAMLNADPQVRVEKVGNEGSAYGKPFSGGRRRGPRLRRSGSR